MTAINKNKIYAYVGSLLVAAVLLLVVLSGIATGREKAQAEVVLNAETSAIKALQYFYEDQNRYPTSAEFGEQNVMLNYLTTFPLPNFPSPVCNQSFQYTRVSPDSYQLDFCLIRGAGGYKKGWNEVTESK